MNEHNITIPNIPRIFKSAIGKTDGLRGTAVHYFNSHAMSVVASHLSMRNLHQ